MRPKAEWAIDSEAMRARGIILLMMMMMMINFISVSGLLAGHVRPTNMGH